LIIVDCFVVELLAMTCYNLTEMISFLSGTVIIRDDPFLIIDVNGVGYKVYATSDALAEAKVDSPLKVFIYTHVREDILDLYGFSKYSDLKLFESLIGVSGVGPKTAIGVFAVGSSDQILQAIINADTSFFSRVPRLGTKNAQKIIIELKNKVGGGELNLSDGSNSNHAEVSAALKGFGFSSSEIREAVGKLDGSLTVEAQIKEALRHLGK
jgi:Holliday junction DNA helicase RuvA